MYLQQTQLMLMTGLDYLDAHSVVSFSVQLWLYHANTTILLIDVSAVCPEKHVK